MTPEPPITPETADIVPESRAADSPAGNGQRANRRGNPVARVLIAPIRFYQRFISPGLPATCRYYPTCSAYAVEALQIHGVFRGTWLTLRRLGRCQPWSKREHFDPVPPLSRKEMKQQRALAASVDSAPAAGTASSSFAPPRTGPAPVRGEDQGRRREPVGPAGSSPSGPPADRGLWAPALTTGIIDHPVRRRPA